MVRVDIYVKQTELREEISCQLAKAFGKKVSVKAVETLEELLAVGKSGKGRGCPDILILDLEKETDAVIDLAIRVQMTIENLKIIFLAEEASAVMEIFRAQPSGFLLKPIKKDKLIASVDTIIEQLEQEERNYFVVTFKGCVFQIKTRDILYFESQKRTVILHCREESWVVYRKLDEIQAEMPDYFVRCHQSYLVNMNCVAGMKAFRLVMNHGKQLPISRPRYSETKELFRDFLG